MIPIKIKKKDETHWIITPKGDSIGWVVYGRTKDEAVNAFTDWSVYTEVYEVSE